MSTSNRSSEPTPVGAAAYARIAFFAVLTVVFLIGGVALTITPPAPDGRWGGGVFVGLFLITLGLMTGTITVVFGRQVLPDARRQATGSAPVGPAVVITIGLFLCVSGVFLGLAGPLIGWALAVVGAVAAVWQIRTNLAERG